MIFYAIFRRYSWQFGIILIKLLILNEERYCPLNSHSWLFFFWYLEIFKNETGETRARIVFLFFSSFWKKKMRRIFTNIVKSIQLGIKLLLLHCLRLSTRMKLLRFLTSILQTKNFSRRMVVFLILIIFRRHVQIGVKFLLFFISYKLSFWFLFFPLSWVLSWPLFLIWL